MADLRIDLAAEFRGKKAFKQADKATTSLDKAVGKLGKQLASVFAATKVIAFGKASLKAFIEDEQAAIKLSTAVKNLGLAFAQPQIDNYINKLELSAGIVDEQLRPAFQALLTTTGSLTKSQELLSIAIEGARGSGKDLTTVAQDLAQAYVGNTRGLRKYNLGLTQVQLKTASFAEIQAKFQQQFSGANQAYLATYAGKLDVLAVAADRAKETIGKGLVDALVLAAGKDADIQDVANAMDSLSQFTADAVRGVGVLGSKFSALDKTLSGGLLGKLLAANFRYGFLGQLAALGQEAQAKPRAGRRFMGGAQANLYSSSDAAEKKYQAQQKKLADAQTKATKALTAEQKKQLALKKAGSIFDLEQIQLIAALKGQLSDEDRKRVELQFALLTGNTKEAQLLTYELAKAQGLGEKIAKDLASLPQAANPFASWEAYLDELMTKARQVANAGSAVVITGGGGGINTGTGNYGGLAGAGQAGGGGMPVTNVAVLPKVTPNLGSGNYGGLGGAGIYGGGGAPVIVQIDGKAVASALQDSSLSGIGSTVNRITSER
jgi:hypothetical protein